MKNSVIYARCSSSFESHRQQTDRQVSDLTQYANNNRLIINKIFEEYISGAKKNSERAVLQDCLNYCKDNGVDLLMVSELSRIGRNVDEVLASVRFCKTHKINVFFQKEGLYIFDNEGNENPYLTIMIAVLGTAAQLEREAIRFRLQSGYRARVAKLGTVGMGRPKGTVMSKEQIEMKYPKVVKELKRGTSIRRTAKLTDVAPSTVQKIKKTLGL